MNDTNSGGRGLRAAGEKFSPHAASGFVVALCWCAFVMAGFAQPATNSPPAKPVFCIVCGKGPLSGTVWLHRRGYVCDECNKLGTRCAICYLPAKDGFIKSRDGRIICKFDAPTAVFAQEEARRIFDGVVRDLVNTNGPAFALRSTNVTVTLFDVDYWNQRDDKQHGPAARQNGFSKTVRAGGDVTHNVLLLSGVPRAEMASVCAHEYTHLWLNENLLPARKIEPNTLEALCELVAHKLAVARQDAAEQERIEKNRYTEGRITTMIALEAKSGLPAILDWARNGLSETADAATLAAATTPPAPVGTLFQPMRAQPRLAETSLRLVGLFIGATRRSAQINDQLFAPNEQRAIRLGDKTVLVRCVEIRPDSVIVTVDGATNPVTLYQLGR